MRLTTTRRPVDGVMQGPGAQWFFFFFLGGGGAGVAEHGAFERSGWAHFDNEASSVMDEIFRRADAFVFGRRTYEIFAGSWGNMGRSGRQPDLDRVEHPAQVRGTDHSLRPELGEHDSPLR